jgi:DNA-binding transcriptional regulator YiaG
MKTPPVEGWKPTKINYPVKIATLDGTAIAETVEVEIDAWKNTEGELFLDGEAREKIENAKARYMGLLTPAEIKDIRISKLKATQDQVSSWLQLGRKTWSRWESGRERPSRSMNVLLCALRDGKIGAEYLESLRFGRKVGYAWQEQPMALTKWKWASVFRTAYRIPRRQPEQVRSMLKAIDLLVSRGEEGDPLAIELKATKDRSSFAATSHRYQTYVFAAAKYHQQVETPWCWTNQPRRTGLLLSS